jgi:predicted DNA-binding ribbon-helix-helix protein
VGLDGFATRLRQHMHDTLKRSISIAGHRTSVSLEPEFWAALKTVAEAEGKPLAVLVGEIDRNRGRRNLSSAIRVWILNRLQSQG